MMSLRSQQSYLVLDYLQNQMIQQLHQHFIYRSKVEEEDIKKILSALNEIPLMTAYTLLLARIEQGWVYAQLLVSLNDDCLIQNYLQLLKKIFQHPLSPQQAYDFLALKDEQGQLLGRKGNIVTKQLYIEFVIALSPRLGKNFNLMQVLSEVDANNKHFFHDLIQDMPISLPLFLSIMEQTILPHYLLILFLKERKFICSQLLLHVSTLSEEQAINTLKNALNEDHSLGKLFWWECGKKEPKMIKQIRLTLQTLQPFADHLSNLEIILAKNKPPKQRLIGGFFEVEMKEAKGEYIPLKRLNGNQSK